MTDLADLITPAYLGFADLLAAEPGGSWDEPSLCDGWLVRHVVAHVSMPARLTPELFGAEMAAAGGDFAVLSNTVAIRDGDLPIGDLLAQLRAPALHAWQPPGGGAAGALSHIVIHSLDATLALGRPPSVAPQALVAVLDLLTAADGRWFGVDLAGVRLETADGGWAWGAGEPLRADAGSLIALLSGRTLPDGRTLPRQLRS